ncbi:MAG TPA: TRAP transporter small permease [Geminicoccaceae bacterium]|nr:TRAP transporter small permease [Geminicoccaceae bacterium]
MTERPSAARALLDRVYWLAGVAAGLFLVAILVIVVLQILTRYFGIPFPGSTDYAGYCMAAASFLALAYTFGAGGHIRVELVLQRLHGPARRVAQTAAYLVGAGLAWYFAWFALRAVRVSRVLGDVSQGQDATPLWIPQLGMAAGTLLFAVALTDHLVRLLRTGRDPTADGLPQDQV